MLKRLRERAGSEKGFTLIELLVVMLILGILAAIAIPAFLNQKGKANDASAKEMARTMQTAEETCSTDNNGDYTSCNLARLQAIEPTIQSAASGPVTAVQVVASSPTGYTVKTTALGGNTFTITRGNTGTVNRTCTTAGNGGCPPGGTW